jgi:hypothetical protein
MKLTKSQRLFMAAGQVQNELMLQKAYYAPWDDGREESGKYIKEYKALRKRLIREALEAWQQEQDSTGLRALNEQLID